MINTAQQQIFKISVGIRLIKNFLSLMVGNIISKLLTFLGFVIIARNLGPENFGKINFAQAISTYFLIFTHLGLTTFGTREIANNRDKSAIYVNEIISLRLILTVLSFILLTVFSFIIKFPADTRTLIILFGLSLFPLAMYLDWCFKGLENMEFIGMSEIFKAVFLYIFLIIFIKKSEDTGLVPYIFFISALLGSILLFIIYLVKFDKIKLIGNMNTWRVLTKAALPLGLSFMMIQIYYQAGTVILGFFKGDAAVGWYNAAYKIILFIIGFAGLFIESIFPIIARFYGKSKQNLNKFSNLITKLTASIAIPMGVAGVILTPQIITLFYGPDYHNCIIILRTFFCTAVIILISMTFGNSLIACSGEKKYLIGVFIGALTNIIVNLLLIPYFNYVGAAIAMFVTETIVFIYMMYHYSRIVRVYIEQYLAKPIIASLIMGALVIMLKQTFFISLIIAIAIYSAVFLLMKGINHEDINSIKYYFHEAKD